MPASRRSLPTARLATGVLALVAATLGACTSPGPAPSPAATGTVRERVAAIALRQVDFGALSLIPVRFENSRIAGPFEDGGRTLYCVSSRMLGRTFDGAERPKAVIRDAGGALTVVANEAEVCEGRRGEPFPELDGAGNRAG